MKYLIFTGILISSNGTLLSQTERPSWVNPTRDTLYLENTSFGMIIFRSWDDVPLKERPVIVFKDSAWIKEKNRWEITKNREFKSGD